MSDIFDILRRSNANGRITAPESDEWSDFYDGATAEGRRAMALGAHRKAAKAEARLAELEAPPEPEPAQRDQFHAKNHVLLNRILGRPATTKES